MLLRPKEAALYEEAMREKAREFVDNWTNAWVCCIATTEKYTGRKQFLSDKRRPPPWAHLINETCDWEVPKRIVKYAKEYALEQYGIEDVWG